MSHHRRGYALEVLVSGWPGDGLNVYGSL